MRQLILFDEFRNCNTSEAIHILFSSTIAVANLLVEMISSCEMSSFKLVGRYFSTLQIRFGFEAWLKGIVLQKYGIFTMASSQSSQTSWNEIYNSLDPRIRQTDAIDTNAKLIRLFPLSIVSTYDNSSQSRRSVIYRTFCI